MPDGNQPFSGASGPSWNDATLAAEIRRREAAGEPIWPELSPEKSEQRRRRHLRKAISWSAAALFFLIGSFADLVIGRAATALAPFAVFVVAACWAVHHFRASGPAR